MHVCKNYIHQLPAGRQVLLSAQFHSVGETSCTHVPNYGETEGALTLLMIHWNVPLHSFAVKLNVPMLKLWEKFGMWQVKKNLQHVDLVYSLNYFWKFILQVMIKLILLDFLFSYAENGVLWYLYKAEFMPLGVQFVVPIFLV